MNNENAEPDWSPAPLHTSWDDLLEDVRTPEDWAEKRKAIQQRFLTLLLDDAAPEPPSDYDIKLLREWDADEFCVQYMSYLVEPDERAHAYVAIPKTQPPKEGFPGVVCLHGTTNWGARRTLGMSPPPDDPHADRNSPREKISGKDYARNLVMNGYVTISPEHFCSASRMPPEGPFDTAAFYKKHPGWSAVGKYMYDSRIACSILASRPDVNRNKLGVTGHSLGGHGSIWLAAYDERILCAAPSCSARTFRENPDPLHWSRDRWYVYFPQLREQFLAGRQIQCDFHEMMSLIAPRPFLERLALNDGHPPGQAHRTMLHLKIHELYRLLEAEPAHAFLAFNDGHAIPDLSRTCLISWMDRWLKFNGDPFGAWKDSPTPVPQ